MIDLVKLEREVQSCIPHLKVDVGQRQDGIVIVRGQTKDERCYKALGCSEKEILEKGTDFIARKIETAIEEERLASSD